MLLRALALAAVLLLPATAAAADGDWPRDTPSDTPPSGDAPQGPAPEPLPPLPAPAPTPAPAPAPTPAPDDTETPEPPRVWQFGARAFVGPGGYAVLNICIDACDANSGGSYLFEGAEVYGAFGRPTDHTRWQTTIDLLYGASERSNQGTLFAIRAVTGLRYLSNPAGPTSFVLELNGGLSYYAVSSPGTSAPMAGGTLRMGGEFGPIELLGAVSADTILLAGAASATLSVGYAFDR